MDFASLMKSQIGAAKTADTGDKKYLKRSEVEAQRQAKYWKEQEERESSRIERLEKKRKRDEEEAEQKACREEKRKRLAEESRRIEQEQTTDEENQRRKRLGLPPLKRESDVDTSAELEDGEADIPEEDLLLKLQDLEEPRFLFGETHVQRVRRYRKLIEKTLAPTWSNGPIPTTIQLVEETDMKVPNAIPKDAEGRTFLIRQLASYFDMVLSEWSIALSRRPKEVKESFTGRQAYNSFSAARDNLIPLFRKLESGDLADELLASVLNIVDLAQQKRYVHANDAYLTLSIGKAAWPIGVTMVGIHERSAREKLHESEKNADRAHILSDEVTRKLLQGIKRCLSFAQTRWPPEDLGQLMG